MRLRPHHLLCIQKFSGHGYDADFTVHMTSVVNLLTGNKDEEIDIVRGCDALCEKCPNNVCGKCTSFEKVDAMDASVLDECGISYGETAPWAVLSEIARMRIFEGSGKICKDCQWFELCKKTEV